MTIVQSKLYACMNMLTRESILQM